MFEKIQPSKKKSVRVAEQIIEAIETGGLKPGEKLPSEHELADKMNISRPSVREALSGLQALDIVNTKIGSGTYVSETITESNLISPDLSVIEDEVSHLQIIEARKKIENALLEIVITKIGVKGLRQLRDILTTMKSHSSEREYEQYMNADHDFHETLIGLSDNPLAVEASRPLVASINGSLYRELTHKYYLIDDSRIQNCYKIHNDLFAALAKGNLQEAKESMNRHWQLMENALNNSEY